MNQLQRFPENVHKMLFSDVTQTVAPIINLQANTTL
jgi:hypothetical protein